jgi:peptide/nickel transport system substrate-binding protein
VGSSPGADTEFDKFERFLEEWSRRDFLRGIGGAAAFSALLVGGAEFLAACGGSSQTTTQNVVKGGHLTEGWPQDIATANPIFINDVYSNILASRFYEGLLVTDGAGNLTPAVATEVPKVESDQLTYRFNLRRDVKWSDGRPLTADDVVFTWQLLYDPKYKAVTSRFRAQAEQYMASVTAVDQYTVVFKTVTPWAAFLYAWANSPFILPKHVWEGLQPAEINSTTMNQVPTVVSGVMAPVKWDKGAQYQLKRNDTYYRGRSNLDAFVYRVIPDAVQAANLLKTSEIDVAMVDPSAWDSLATAQNVQRVPFIRPSFDYYSHNLDPAKTPKAAIFGEPQVRKALYMALDRKKIASKIYFNLAAPADSVYSNAQWVHVAPKTQYPFDPKKAAQMLDDAGWRKGADGVRAKNGVRMEWELLTNAGNVARQTLVSYMADQWKSLGIEVTTRLLPLPQLVTTLNTTRQFDMGLIGISESLDPDTTQIYSSKSIGNGALNSAAYRNPKIDDLLDQGVRVVDREKRRQIYQQIQDILAEDLAFSPIVYSKAAWGISKRVKNFNTAPWNIYGARPWFKDVFVTDGK